MANRMKKRPVFCLDLSQKLTVLYEAVGRHAKLEKPNNHAELAAYVGVARSTISTWRRGATNRGRARHMVSPDDISILSKIFVDLAPQISSQSAFELWTSADIDSFRRRLLSHEDSSILKLLKDKEPTLKVTPSILSGGLGLIREEYEPDDGDWNINEGSQFCLYVDSKKGRIVIVLSHGPTGLLWLSPNCHSHDGMVRSVPEIIPNSSNGWIVAVLGKSDLYCIEIATRTAPYIRPKTGDMWLTPEIETRLVEELQDERLNGDWRWCKIPIFVSKRPS